MTMLYLRGVMLMAVIYRLQFSDVERLLTTYQLWLDDLYPRAKFADGLAIIEKVGHAKRIQIMRKQWIDEGKPRLSTVDASEEHLDAGTRSVPLEGGSSEEHRPSADSHSQVDFSESHTDLGGCLSRSRPHVAHVMNASGEPDDDELDALLAEGGRSDPNVRSLFGTGLPTVPKSKPPEDDYADDMEAMADMEDTW